ncbi:ferredoxin--NADP reductase [Pseudomonas sp. 6D_7.1_Bac1]|jgi:3-ketosteroid 9alpha-monooxygenase subunit B|uniref:ferredoxin--NADP reductase n=1 Tax=Pseudomonas sp. 6D_7.1_Bac1 TaxID=2971615 RepID=UPI0021C9364B|nr:ferredoxin--NADP reductase [Pseudomonas sp. 6D_7.1_Bac1]MCU1747987.1 ferredoxin--NADP reductase [Pseudomonas sp. 6D_7.1_Bac1]
MGTQQLNLNPAEPSITGSYLLQVSAVIDETFDARSLVFEVPPALRERFRYRPGQFLSFRVPFAGKLLTRCYSMASSPLCDALPKVTVKRVEGGRVSNWMNQVQVGDWLDVLPPAGHFCLDSPRNTDEQRPLVLFGGGSGITPVFSILKSALHSGTRSITLIYANRDEASVIFKEELRQLAKAHPERLEVFHLLDSVQGFLSDAQVRQLVRHRRAGEYFICGPGPFMDTVEGALLALGESRETIHVERFVSPPDPDQLEALEIQARAAAAESVCEALIVELDGQQHEIACQPGDTLLQSCKVAGLDVPSSCEEGFCGACMCVIKEGQTQLARNDVLSERELADGWTLACQSRPTGARVHLKFPD